MSATQIDLGTQARAGTLTDTQISASAAISFSKLGSLATGQLVIGNAGVAAAVALGGDATINAAGVLTIGTGAVGDAKLALLYTKADGSRAFTGDQSMGGFNLTSLATPLSSTDAASKGYVDSVAAGLSVKNSVRAISVANITLSGTQTIDGVVLIVGNRVLVTAQASGINNGIYLVAAGAWTRSADLAAASSAAGAFAFVEEGTVYKSTGWVCNNPEASAVVGTNSLGFTEFSATGGITGSGTAGQIAFFTSSGVISSNSNLAWDNTEKSLVIGGFPSNTPFALPQIEVIGSGGDPAAHIATVFGNSGGDPVFIGARAGGTQAVPLATPSGKSLIQVIATGHDGTSFQFSSNPGIIRFFANETWGATAYGTDFTLGLTPTGSTTGSVVLFATANNSGQFVVNGNLSHSSQYKIEAIADGAFNAIAMTSFGGGSSFFGAHAGGSLASPAATPSGDTIAQFGAIGYDTAFVTAAPGGKLNFIAAELWTGSAHGTDLNIKLVRPGTLSSSTVIYASATGGVGRIGIGNAAAVTPSSALEVSTDESGATEAFKATIYSSTSNAVQIRRARGTFASPSAIQTGDVINATGGRGYGATGFASASRAVMQIQAAENWTDTAQGARIVFQTTPTGGTATAEAARFSPSGDLGLGTTSPQYKLDLQADGTNGITAVTSYGSVSGAQSVFLGRQAGGTQASPTATQTNARLAVLAGEGWDTSFANPSGSVEIRAEEAFTASAHGTSVKITTTALGSISSTTRVYVAPSGNTGFGGNTSPNYAVDVTGEVNISTGSKYRVNGTQIGLGDLNGVTMTATEANAVGLFATRETPSGAVDGSNVTFTLANTPIAGSEMVFLNGELQEPGAGNDYTISGAVITYLTAPLTTYRLRVSYRYH